MILLEKTKKCFDALNAGLIRGAWTTKSHLPNAEDPHMAPGLTGKESTLSP